MRTPSIKTLSDVFEDPKQAKRVFLMTRRELEKTPGGKAFIAQCHHGYVDHVSHLRMVVLNSLDPGLHGVESMKVGRNDEYADYLNTGETYAATVIYWRGFYRVQSVGDFVETMERNGLRAS
jgi:hypothetical protein